MVRNVYVAVQILYIGSVWSNIFSREIFFKCLLSSPCCNMMVYWSQVRVFNGFKNIMRRRRSRSGLYNYYSLFALKLTCTTTVTKRTIFEICTVFQAKHFICAPSLKMVLFTSLLQTRNEGVDTNKNFLPIFMK